MLQRAEIAAIVLVSDIDQAVVFYGETLGLELQVRRDDLAKNREAEFRGGDGTLVVYESVAAAPPGRATPTGTSSRSSSATEGLAGPFSGRARPCLRGWATGALLHARQEGAA